MSDDPIEFHLYINTKFHKGVKGYGLSWGERNEWFSTLAGAKNRAEYYYEVKEWTRNRPGEYEAIGRVREGDRDYWRSHYDPDFRKPASSKLRERLKEKALPSGNPKEEMTEQQLDAMQRAFMDSVDQSSRRKK